MNRVAVPPAKAGAHPSLNTAPDLRKQGSRFRGNDEVSHV